MKEYIKTLRIQGYRPFKDCAVAFNKLEVIVGANGAGKSSLFEFMRFLRDAVYQEIPPDIVAGSTGQQIFHNGSGQERFSWNLEIDTGRPVTVNYQGVLAGPAGKTHIASERVLLSKPLGTKSKPMIFMDFTDGKGVVHDPGIKKFKPVEISLGRPNQLALSTMTNQNFDVLYRLREYLLKWRFYNAFNFNNAKIRKPVLIEQEPVLHEDASNLSSVLHYFMSEKREAFDELEAHLNSAVPGFKGLNVKARGGKGEIIAFWKEAGMDDDLSLADLSDGTLRLICWMALSVHPDPPSLICIDEPDQGVHPRTLPVLAGLFEKAADRTQVLLASHASYFVSQFGVEHIAVMRKQDGEAVFMKPKDSKLLVENLREFGTEELEIMHRSDELECLS